MEYEIKTFDDLCFQGYVKTFSTKDNQQFTDIPEFWASLHESGKFAELLEKSDAMGPVGISYGYNPETETFNYLIGIRNTTDTIEGTEVVEFDPTRFAIFKSVGPLPDAFQRTISTVHQHFFKQTDFERASGPEIEMYGEGNPDDESYEAWYFVPIKAK